METPARAGKRVRVGGLVCVALLAAWGLHGSRYERTPNRAPELSSPLPDVAPVCRLQGPRAWARASELETLGDARWERAQFDAVDGAKAVMLLAEAESCFRAAFDRDAEQRVRQKLRGFRTEVERSWERSRVLLGVAQRQNDAGSMRREVRLQLKLSSQLGEVGEDYRAWLRSLGRAADLQMVEVTRAKESK